MMPKEFYTERDIEDMFKRGVMSLNVSENVVLTELAYEKANRLGMQLLRSQPDNPPSAPVRPYISQKSAPVMPIFQPGNPVEQTERDLQSRIHAAVIARMGNQVDPELLDVIIQRVLKSTGVK
jgi:hypothetical protein